MWQYIAISVLLLLTLWLGLRKPRQEPVKDDRYEQGIVSLLKAIHDDARTRPTEATYSETAYKNAITEFQKLPLTHHDALVKEFKAIQNAVQACDTAYDYKTFEKLASQVALWGAEVAPKTLALAQKTVQDIEALRIKQETFCKNVATLRKTVQDHVNYTHYVQFIFGTKLDTSTIPIDKANARYTLFAIMVGLNHDDNGSNHEFDTIKKDSAFLASVDKFIGHVSSTPNWLNDDKTLKSALSNLQLTSSAGAVQSFGGSRDKPYATPSMLLHNMGCTSTGQTDNVAVGIVPATLSTVKVTDALDTKNRCTVYWTGECALGVRFKTAHGHQTCVHVFYYEGTRLSGWTGILPENDAAKEAILYPLLCVSAGQQIFAAAISSHTTI